MRVLIAEDDAVTRRVLEANLQRWGYEVILARDGLQAHEILCNDRSIQLAILDWMMPGAQGPDLCRELRERSGPYVYVLLLTSKQGSRDLVQGLEAGADDFLRKPFDAAELEARLRTGHRLASLEEKLRIQATTDPLTRILNRGATFEALREGSRRAARDGAPISVVIADVDRFKSINDTHGHAAGDLVLVETARRMRASLRAEEVLGRWGGEEFLIALPGVPQAAAFTIAERVRHAVGDTPLCDVPGRTIGVTLSLGVASVPLATNSVELEALVRDADLALYRAKANGRDRVELAGGGGQVLALSRRIARQA